MNPETADSSQVAPGGDKGRYFSAAPSTNHPSEKVTREGDTVKILAVENKSQAELPEQFPCLDAASIDLSDSKTWPAMGLLIQGRFGGFLQRCLPAEYSEFRRTGEFRDQELVDVSFLEFVLQQARILGVRILFDPEVLTTVYHVTHRSPLGPHFWRTFAGNIQNLLDDKRQDARQGMSVSRKDLIKGLKRLKKEVLKMKAAEAAREMKPASVWDFDVIVNHLPGLIDKYSSNALRSNFHLFVAYVKGDEGAFRTWLSGDDNARFAGGFLNSVLKYKNPEAMRQAIFRASDKKK